MVKIGLIGGGYWGKNLIREFNNTGSLHTICDINEEALKKYNELYPEVQTTTNWDNVLNNEEITAVCIALPAEMHYSFAKKSLFANKDVYVEKPITLNVNEAEELVEIAKTKNKILMVGHLLHYHPAMVKVKSMIEEGKIGRVKNIIANRLSLGIFRKHENVLWSFAPHDISVVLSLVKQVPLSVVCHGKDHINEGVHDVTNSILKFKDAYVNINVNWLNPYKEQKMSIIGEKGMIIFDDVSKENKITYFPEYIEYSSDINANPTPVKNNAENIEVDLSKSPLLAECEHFVECCETRNTPITPGEEGVNVLKVLNGLQESLLNNREVKLVSKKKLNILVTCVGSAPSKAVVQALKQSEKYDFNIIGIDMSDVCAGTFLCDIYKEFPSFKSNDYKEKIYELIEEHNIDFIIPTYSKELNYWAEFKTIIEKKYSHCKVVSNNTKVIDIANNKNNTIEFCKKNDILFPDVFTLNDIDTNFDNYPIIIKPHEGSGATGIYKCDNYTDFMKYKEIINEEYIIQKFVTGPEYTCDVISNSDEHVISVIPKRRIKIVNGAAIQSITEKNEKVIEYVKDVAVKIKNKHTMNIQVIEDITNGKIYMVEINPRFPTSLPLTTAADVNIPELLIDNYFNENNINIEFKNNLTMYRHYTEYFL